MKRDRYSKEYPVQAGAIVTSLELRESSRHPSLSAYWVPGFISPTEGLPAHARHLAPIFVGKTVEIDHPSTPEHGATIALYSLARDETIEVIHLPPIVKDESSSQ